MGFACMIDNIADNWCCTHKNKVNVTPCFDAWMTFSLPLPFHFSLFLQIHSHKYTDIVILHKHSNPQSHESKSGTSMQNKATQKNRHYQKDLSVSGGSTHFTKYSPTQIHVRTETNTTSSGSKHTWRSPHMWKDRMERKIKGKVVPRKSLMAVILAFKMQWWHSSGSKHTSTTMERQTKYDTDTQTHTLFG